LSEDLSVLDREVASVISSIPRGKVTTIKTIAESLGDKRATLAVFLSLKKLKNRGIEGWHRVVRENLQADPDAIPLLKAEGVTIRGNAVDRSFITERVRKSAILLRMRYAQRMMRDSLVLKEVEDVRTAAGVDVAYAGDVAFGACVVMDRNFNVVEKSVVKVKALFPYIPTYLAFREFRPMYLAARRCEFDVLFVDGHGLLHPELFGEACHLGVALRKPTIGAAKSLLVGEISGNKVFVNGIHLGWVLGGSYISPGNMISIDDSLKISKMFLLNRSQPEPLILAHMESKMASTKQS
jgi:deoxyribonuclease V